MKIRNFKTRVIAPVLLLIPMACMHLGDGHHSGHQHSFSTQLSYEGSICESLSKGGGARDSALLPREPE